MNVGGHIAVATVDHAEPLFWLGSALPDLASMGRFRLLGSTDNPLVQDGIRFHHATDSAFHRHPWFVATQRRLQQQLESDGLARGPSRAIAHVGPELLLDGSIDHETATASALASIEAATNNLEALVIPEHRPRWLEHLTNLGSTPVPSDHGDPDAVAVRLHRILSRRSRLAFDAHHIPTVSGRLAAAQPDIESTADPLVAELAGQLRANPS